MTNNLKHKTNNDLGQMIYIYVKHPIMINDVSQSSYDKSFIEQKQIQ